MKTRTDKKEKRRRAIILHGFNVSDGGESTTDTLIEQLEEKGFEVITFDTEWSFGILRDLLRVRFSNKKRARELAKMIRAGDLLVGHSNGCAIIDIATWYLASLDRSIQVGCLFINPALDSDAPISPIVSDCWIMHTKTDRVVGLAKRMIFSRWGAMGRDGYQGKPDSRIVSLTHEHHGLEDTGHSGIFKKKRGVDAICFRADLLDQLMRSREKKDS